MYSQDDPALVTQKSTNRVDVRCILYFPEGAFFMYADFVESINLKTNPDINCSIY